MEGLGAWVEKEAIEEPPADSRPGSPLTDEQRLNQLMNDYEPRHTKRSWRLKKDTYNGERLYGENVMCPPPCNALNFVSFTKSGFEVSEERTVICMACRKVIQHKLTKPDEW